MRRFLLTLSLAMFFSAQSASAQLGGGGGGGVNQSEFHSWITNGSLVESGTDVILVGSSSWQLDSGTDPKKVVFQVGAASYSKNFTGVENGSKTALTSTEGVGTGSKGFSLYVDDQAGGPANIELLDSFTLTVPTGKSITFSRALARKQDAPSLDYAVKYRYIYEDNDGGKLHVRVFIEDDNSTWQKIRGCPICC